jgi:hypothetical protein
MDFRRSRKRIDAVDLRTCSNCMLNGSRNEHDYIDNDSETSQIKIRKIFFPRDPFWPVITLPVRGAPRKKSQGNTIVGPTVGSHSRN